MHKPQPQPFLATLVSPSHPLHPHMTMQAMNFMPGCSIFKACRAASPGPDDVAGNWTEAVSSNPDACRHLNLVATVCTHDTGMGMMKGCQNNFNSMCKNGSVVPKCKTMTGFPELPATKAVNAAVSWGGWRVWSEYGGRGFEWWMAEGGLRGVVATAGGG